MTTLGAIAAAMVDVIQGVPLAGGRTWSQKRGLEDVDESNAPESDCHFAFEYPDDPRVVFIAGDPRAHGVTDRIHVVLMREVGDPQIDVATLKDDARAVADAIENGAYPEGVVLVAVDSQRIEGAGAFRTARLVVRVEFEAAVSVAA
jgi:hypothetical protein